MNKESFMKSLTELLENYEQYHAQPTTKILHYIGVPAVIIGLLILFEWFTLGFFGHWFISFAWLFVIALLVYYYFLNVRLALLMTVILLVLTGIVTWLAPPMPTKLSVILFLVFLIGGGVLQFIGHTLEKTKPSLTSGLMQMLITPLFIILELLALLKWKKFFVEEIHHRPTKT